MKPLSGVSKMHNQTHLDTVRHIKTQLDTVRHSQTQLDTVKHSKTQLDTVSQNLIQTFLDFTKFDKNACFEDVFNFQAQYVTHSQTLNDIFVLLTLNGVWTILQFHASADEIQQIFIA